MLSTGIFFGLVSMIGFGINNAMAQSISKKYGSLGAIIYRNAIIVMLLFITTLFYYSGNKFPLYHILFSVGIAFVGYVSLVSFMHAVKIGKIGVVVPIANSSSIFTVLFAVLFFSEILTLNKLIAIAIIITGVVLISVNIKDFKRSELFVLSSGIPYAFLTMILWGLVFALFRIPVKSLGPFFTTLIIELSILIFSCVHLFLIKKESLKKPVKSMIPSLLMFGLFGYLGSLFFNLGIQVAEVSIVAPIAFSAPAISVLYARLVYKEKLLLRQYIAVVCIIFGIIFMSAI
ncbi:hypothetical protein A3H80_02840 [Candidatus Roizmanbacteria bacterium RIFCSPLOWO2_02_FULL_37_19]|uniref:EamA domain-containing protein n=1 Tax=Candidatus Roizmanbacteria bacterium RIFCSPHIGHO2_02_FULL_37_24 TaxID=1802037 RepID=A0A1F7GUI9_9BACT|nr:MAG: hypothetical protein A2862_02395 [Candidatus Roizmanbacteria bacterium RIFCSPHIGHO2_01_FULL_38_41]OGK22583.1 MAG: hypothetical protein A3C24_04620 [Candidatus Roizmanbacteria bacterium RIFCSPHIGHO2_02_FULL_37_24]OGK32184.1 MAG: hypothetical protein A3E10_03620 [Candidatus Roizmanbacteria bacterium RIFCSPHIGHO2_12_FULL_37_23]OGK44452.1 MAG: hypothetical protein A2956_01265 [Candidatus Roizmanbacteria bacterium RIFCSPLOWO2_01_FULL_37_57]OGK53797.1 MAG: hypothetical protein A3H80_02840 [Ca